MIDDGEEGDAVRSAGRRFGSGGGIICLSSASTVCKLDRGDALVTYADGGSNARSSARRRGVDGADCESLVKVTVGVLDALPD